MDAHQLRAMVPTRICPMHHTSFLPHTGRKGVMTPCMMIVVPVDLLLSTLVLFATPKCPPLRITMNGTGDVVRMRIPLPMLNRNPSILRKSRPTAEGLVVQRRKRRNLPVGLKRARGREVVVGPRGKKNHHIVIIRMLVHHSRPLPFLLLHPRQLVRPIGKPLRSKWRDTIIGIDPARRVPRLANRLHISGIVPMPTITVIGSQCQPIPRYPHSCPTSLPFRD